MDKIKIINKIVLSIGFIALMPIFASASTAGISQRSVIELVNKSREKEGLPVLVENTQLSQAAKDKANDMIKNDYFAHTSPDGKDPWYWLKKIGYKYKFAGENLAINYDSAQEQHTAWMKSATHRKNIMNPSYSEIGIAIVEGKIDGESSLVAVQFFGAPAAAISKLKTEKEQVETAMAQGERKPEVLSANDYLIQSVKQTGTSQAVQEPNLQFESHQVSLKIMVESKFLNISTIIAYCIVFSTFLLNMFIVFSQSIFHFGKFQNIQSKAAIFEQ